MDGWLEGWSRCAGSSGGRAKSRFMDVVKERGEDAVGKIEADDWLGPPRMGVARNQTFWKLLLNSDIESSSVQIPLTIWHPTR